ncbi:sugar transferase [Klebsiella pneumoniae]|uniref:sugar transferase n=1 Tax=Klebsiella pneumoniae TaxID=573 RepID=UPI003F761D33
MNGLRGETNTLGKMSDRVEYDVDYIRNWSLWFDLRIIAKTIVIAFLGKNAY